MKGQSSGCMFELFGTTHAEHSWINCLKKKLVLYMKIRFDVA